MNNRIWTPGSKTGLSRREALALGLAGATWAAQPRIAAAQGTPAPPSKPTGQVIVGLSQEPTVFNPLMPHIEVDQGVHWNVFSPLWNVDARGNFIPQLATEVPTIGNGGISEDGLEWRVKLRSGRHLARRHAVHRRRCEVHAGADQQPAFPRLQPQRPRAGHRHQGGQPDRDHLADEEKLRAVRVDPVLDLHRAAAHPGEGG